MPLFSQPGLCTNLEVRPPADFLGRHLVNVRVQVKRPLLRRSQIPKDKNYSMSVAVEPIALRELENKSVLHSFCQQIGKYCPKLTSH